ncbi:acyl-CoA dehydrogenase [Rhodobacterales bacterium HKCCE2091]|nr:acyl-CoA dehydrogenase [Rhodobacterales bacterium HKCCE2091]
MDFDPNDDQRAFLDVLEQMATGPDAAWGHDPDWKRYQWSPALDATLDENGFFDCAAEPDLGPVAGALMVMRLAELPVLVEAAASTLLRPRLAPDLPRPVAVMTGDGPAPFLPVARSVLRLAPDGVSAAVLDLGDVAAAESLFAYPFGQVGTPGAGWQAVDADPDTARDLWRVALAAELAGVLKGGLGAVLEHVRSRRQFGRPLGSFQAVQHRLAGASARIEGGAWMALRAAETGDAADAAQALGWMQASATRIVYDLHQFMGAMGLTLEHPLHRWTYRARWLKSALGGAEANLSLAAARTWGA